MQQKDINWLKAQDINKRFTVCRAADQAYVTDPSFEDWIVTDAQKRPTTLFGDGFKADDHGFSFAGPITLPPVKDNPFPFIEPVYVRLSCSWKHVKAIYEGSGGRVYIFVG